MRLIALFARLTPGLWEQLSHLGCTLDEPHAPKWMLEHLLDFVEPETERGNPVARELLTLLDRMLDELIEAGNAGRLQGTALDRGRQVKWGVPHWRRLRAAPAEVRRWALDFRRDRIRHLVSNADSTKWDGGFTEWDDGFSVWDAGDIVTLEGVDVDIVSSETDLSSSPEQSAPEPPAGASQQDDPPKSPEGADMEIMPSGADPALVKGVDVNLGPSGADTTDETDDTAPKPLSREAGLHRALQLLDIRQGQSIPEQALGRAVRKLCEIRLLPDGRVPRRWGDKHLARLARKILNPVKAG